MDKAIILVLISHYIGDFVFQTEWMAKNKGESMAAMSAHVVCYGATLTVFASLISLNPNFIISYIVLNTVLHLLIDCVSSSFTPELWEKKDYRNFFLVLGVDQLVHQLALIASLLPFGYLFS